VTPTWMAAAINAMFERVPNPGFSLNGIHKRSTNELIANVDQPIVISSRFEIPCASTDHGAFPISLWINSESPRPKINKPKKSTLTRSGDNSHRDFAVHGV